MRDALLLGVGNGIDQDEAPFRVGVEHFDGLSRHRCHDVAGTLSLTADHVFHGRNERGDGDRGLQLGNAAHRAKHSCSTAHVALHLFHAVGGLDGHAAGIERHALAD